jgi:hypothetical protein
MYNKRNPKNEKDTMISAPTSNKVLKNQITNPLKENQKDETERKNRINEE